MAHESLPLRGRFVTDAIVQIYADGIDSVLSDLGRQVTLYLPPTILECPNCKSGPDGSSNGVYETTNPNPLGQFNKPFPAGGLCGVCQATHKIKTANTIDYTATITRSPKDVDYTQYGEDITPDNTFKTKMKLVAYEDILRTEKAMIDGQMCKKLRHPIKTGLRDLRYVQGYWTRINA